MNLASLMTLKKEWDGFKQRHPKFPLFVKAARQKAMQEGAVIEIHVTAPDGTDVSSNFKIQPEDLELFNRLQELKG